MNLNDNGAVQNKIEITNGVKHIVPLDEIVGGGPPKDGIPSIDHPKFISAANAGIRLQENDPGIMLSFGGINRFYPFQILVWHEIVNDTVNGRRVLITYCPLCFSGVVFDPTVDGVQAEFGTSGKLWNSNLVMYDRKTNSLWSQILGEGIVGDEAGVKLSVLRSDIVRFGDFRKLHPDGDVLSRDTGFVRLYGEDPYGNYYTTPGTYFPLTNKDSRLNDKDFVLGIVVNGKAKAYYPPAIKDKGKIEDVFQGKVIVAEYKKDIDVVELFSKENAGTSGGEKKLVPLEHVGSFWFAWAAAHPQTALYK